jgi:hypothetical protein
MANAVERVTYQAKAEQSTGTPSWVFLVDVNGR